MGFAHQIADTFAFIAEVERRRGGAAPAHLVKQAREDDVVARTEAAIVVDQKLRHDKQADALHPSRRVGQAGEHHVHDVFAQRVVAAGDKDFVALEPVAAVRLWLGLGAQV